MNTYVIHAVIGLVFHGVATAWAVWRGIDALDLPRKGRIIACAATFSWWVSLFVYSRVLYIGMTGNTP